MRTVGKLLAITAIAAGAVLAPGGEAAAHNALVASDPVDGAVLERGPDEVALTFLSTLDPAGARLAVVGPDQESVIAGEPEFDGASVRVAVRTGQAGDYAVEYEVLSQDGHVVTGGLRFSVRVGDETSPSPAPEPEPATGEPVASTGSAVVTGHPADASGPWWPWAVLAGLLVAGAAAILLARRRRAG